LYAPKGIWCFVTSRGGTAFAQLLVWWTCTSAAFVLAQKTSPESLDARKAAEIGSPIARPKTASAFHSSRHDSKACSKYVFLNARVNGGSAPRTPEHYEQLSFPASKAKLSSSALRLESVSPC